MKLRLMLFPVTLALAGTAVADTTPDAGRDFPMAVSDRPFTMPKNSFEAAGSVKYHPQPHLNGLSLNRLSLAYGLTDDLQLGLSWGGFSVPDLDVEKSLGLSVGYFAFANAYAAGMVQLDVPLYFQTNAVKTISFSAPTAFGIVPGVGLLAFYSDLVALDVVDKYVAFNFPLKLSWQATKQLHLGISTSLAEFRVGRGEGQTYIWNKPSVNLDALYALDGTFDVFASIGVSNARDLTNSFATSVGIAYRFGALNG